MRPAIITILAINIIGIIFILLQSPTAKLDPARYLDLAETTISKLSNLSDLQNAQIDIAKAQMNSSRQVSNALLKAHDLNNLYTFILIMFDIASLLYLSAISRKYYQKAEQGAAANP